uniref:CCHC-type domain-containing protein n=1 Tax=Ananas comosus var. bracteatus TaxID=296719 RepID=A0A6V7PM03_ANACO|nr:unnamed protein product [Ananas comosus var. bracteatus]
MEKENPANNSPPHIASTPPPQNTSTDLISINATAQLPLKLTHLNYPSWRAQFNALLFGYDLMGFVDGSKSCPPSTIMNDGKPTPNPDFALWVRQDQLLLHAIIASTSENIMSFIASAKTSREAWQKLAHLYANKSRSRVMSLKDRLSSLSRGTKSVSEYLQLIKTTADELAIVDSPLDDIDLVIYTLNGLGPEFKEISAAMKARENPITFEELYDKLIDYENFLKKEEMSHDATVLTANFTRRSNGQGTNSLGRNYNRQNPRSNNGQRNNNQHGPSRPPNFYRKAESPPSHTTRRRGTDQLSTNVTCQYCDRPGHTAKKCYKLHPPSEPMVNFTSSNRLAAQDWLMDSAATHHVTNNMQNLSLHSEYHGPDEIVVGDGSGLPITHTGSSLLSSHSNSFIYLMFFSFLP